MFDGDLQFFSVCVMPVYLSRLDYSILKEDGMGSQSLRTRTRHKLVDRWTMLLLPAPGCLEVWED